MPHNLWRIPKLALIALAATTPGTLAAQAYDGSEEAPNIELPIRAALVEHPPATGQCIRPGIVPLAMVSELPCVRGESDSYFNKRLTAIVAEDSRAYVAGECGVTILDISEPRTPRVVGVVEAPGVSGIDVAGPRLYLSTGTHMAWTEVMGSTGSFEVWNIRDPARPRQVGSQSLEESAYGFVREAGRAFLVDTNGLFTMDLPEPSRPSIIKRLDGLGFASSIYESDHRALVSTGRGVFTFDLRGPQKPRRITREHDVVSAVRVDERWFFTTLFDLFVVSDIASPSPRVERLSREVREGHLARSGSELLIGSEEGLSVVDLDAEPLRVWNAWPSSWTGRVPGPIQALGWIERPLDPHWEPGRISRYFIQAMWAGGKRLLFALADGDDGAVLIAERCMLQ